MASARKAASVLAMLVGSHSGRGDERCVAPWPVHAVLRLLPECMAESNDEYGLEAWLCDSCSLK